ncbi:MAG: FAD-binding protein, partial [Alphaproteobacteria bacterium]|nr:FAD-binding protein [Alphaproteobacteria bacterium]
SRLAEQVWSRGIDRLEEHRAIALVPAADGARIAGVLMIDMRSGDFVFVRAKAVLLATGGGPSMYLYHTPSGDKSCDGMAMALAAGLTLRDMEMVQFHPTGLVAGAHTRITGTIIEEGLRGAGGQLLNAEGSRFLDRYDPAGERATRDIVSRGMFMEMQAGRTGPNGGLYITMRHLDSAMVRREFKGMVERCHDVGFDLVDGLVEVTPTAHYMMGGLVFDTDTSTALPGLFAAGEDTGGVHGANRLGGNGVANSTVFGGIAGDVMADWVRREGAIVDEDGTVIEDAVAGALLPFTRPAGDLTSIQRRMQRITWDDVGIIRDAAGLNRGLAALEALATELQETGVPAGPRLSNVTWHDWLNLRSQILVGRAIATAAQLRQDSRGAHYRTDYPEMDSLQGSRNTLVRLRQGKLAVDTQAVAFTRVRPGETLIESPMQTE